MSYKNDDYGDPLINDDHAVALKLANREELAYIKATTLKINPNTVTRAYKQLEKDGYIILLPGKGIFIKNVTDAFPTMMKEKELQQQLELTLLEMHYHNISQDTINTWYKDFFERILKWCFQPYP